MTKQTWFLGEYMMSQFYTIYDMSQLEDHGYLQVGLGQANTQDLIGKALVDKHNDAVQQSKAVITLVISIIMGLVVLAIYVFVRERKIKE